MTEKETLEITVFGGSKPQAGSQAYQNAEKLGHLLAEKGFTVLTGGYIGTMEAVSRGANQNGGHVVGVTCEEIESWRPVGPNSWVIEERRFPTLRARLYALIDDCDAALALPGGIGTLAEIGAMWAQLQVQGPQNKPLILIGKGWQQTFDTLLKELGEYVAEKDRELVYFAQDVEQAASLLNDLLR